ncbi:hypothetical protein Hanom_Chr07g00595711 [Helianthus anomalus]
MIPHPVMFGSANTGSRSSVSSVKVESRTRLKNRLMSLVLIRNNEQSENSVIAYSVMRWMKLER